MSSQLIQFLDTSLTPISSANVVIKPWSPPFISASSLAMGDSQTLETDANGYISSSLVNGYYKLKIASTYPQTIVFGNVFGNVYTPFSASIFTGSASTVIFNLIDILNNAYAYKEIKLTPADENTVFSGSVIGSGFVSQQIGRTVKGKYF